MRFDHLGVVVPSLAEGREHLSGLLQVAEWTREWADPVNRVYVQFGRDASGTCYELVAPLGEDSPVTKTLAVGRTILNHVAYLVKDLEASGAQLRELGCVPTGEPNPAIAYGNRRIQFFVTPLRFIMELIEAPDHEHLYFKDLGSKLTVDEATSGFHGESGDQQ